MLSWELRHPGKFSQNLKSETVKGFKTTKQQVATEWTPAKF